jgi:hypothetical protein
MTSRCCILVLGLAVVLVACTNESNSTDDGTDAGASDTTPAGLDAVTLQFLVGDAPVPDNLVLDGRFTASLPIDNPAPALGTKHSEDQRAQERIDAFLAAVDGAQRLIIHRQEAAPSRESEPLFQLSGCVENRTIIAEVERLGGALCDPSVLGRAITFANVQLARVAPDGPYNIYEDYVVQSLPLLLATGGCVVGAWLCESHESAFDGIFIPAYPSTAEMLQVANQTSASGPGGSYGDATYADLRIGGVEILVRNLMDLSVITR